MELLFLTGFIIFISFSLLSLFSYASKTINASKPNLPPGRTGFPLIGENLEFLSKCREGRPENFIRERMVKFSSQIFNTSIFGEPMAVICGAAGNKFLFSNENKLVTAWWPKSMNKLFPSSASSEETKRLRTILSSLLKSEALQTYIGMMDTIAQRHFEFGWEGRKEVSVFPLAKNYTFWIACKVFLSIDDPKHVDELARPFNVLLSGIVSIPIDLPGTTFNRSIKASKMVRKELTAIITQRKIDLAKNKPSPEQDIMSHMLLAADENGQYMSELKIADKILGLLVAGHDTASTVITSIVKYLAEFPDIYQKVLTEQIEIAHSKAPGELLNWNDIQKMKYSWNVACEAMRLVPPAQGAFREAIDEFIYAGFTIPKDSKLFWSVHTTNRNPECFSDPEKFDPSRFEGNGPAPYTFVPFGGGPRMCPGKEYARMEILVFMHNIVKRYYWEKTIPDEKIIFDPLPKPANGLPIRLLPPKCI